MTKSQQVLIDLLRKSLFNATIEIPKDVDWLEVYNEASFQSVIPIAFDGTSGIEGIPQEIYKKFKNHTVAVMLNNDNVLKGQRELVALLEKNEIKYAILKGASVARYYPKPELRTLGDVDFLVNKDEFDDVKELLVKNGYNLVEDGYKHFHCALKKNDVTFEMHFEMSEFPKSDLCDELRKELDSTLSKTETAEIMGNEFSSLDDLTQAVSLLLHTERHISKDGIGLRQLADFGFFIKSNPLFMQNEENVEYLKKYGLYKLAAVCVDLFDKYFCGQAIDSPTADMLFELSLKKGNFGIKRSKEETYSNFDIEKKSVFAIVNYFKYFKKRARMTWKLAKKHSWLCNFGFIYLPIRHAFRIIFKKQKVDYKKVLKFNNEVYSLYNDLSIFKR